MQFPGLAAVDFEVFEIPGLDARMAALKTQLRPKLEALGEHLSEFLASRLDCPVYPHVAKHARRTVNPPSDSWVAFCLDKRGYKKHPHFQLGLWQTHVFATFGMIYESPARGPFARALITHANQVLSALPEDYVFIPDHMDPNVIPRRDVTATRLEELATRLAKRHNGELMMGMTIPKEQAITLTGADFIARVESCYERLLPIFQLAQETGVAAK